MEISDVHANILVTTLFFLQSFVLRSYGRNEREREEYVLLNNIQLYFYIRYARAADQN
jgi:hypothetical protein